jgi:alpha-L-arabinofuranosidase
MSDTTGHTDPHDLPVVTPPRPLRASRANLGPWLFTSLVTLLAGCVAPAPRFEGNIVTNPGFAEHVDTLPVGWMIDERVRGRGSARVIPGAGPTAGNVLEIRPNRHNERYLGAIGLGQGYNVGPLRGETLEIAATMRAEEGATAVVGVHVIDMKGGIVDEVRMRRLWTESGWNEVRGRFPVPRSGGSLLIINLHAEGLQGAAYFDHVSVERVAAPSAERIPDVRLQASIVVEAGHSIRQIPRTLYGHNLEWPYGGNLIWDFRAEDFNPDIVRLTRRLNPSLLRFPGGMFADYYRWREGVGPLDQRPESEIHPGGDRSRHTFGTDEALSFARRTGGSLLITVNAHTGTPEEAADWVRYARERARAEGLPPVRFWEVGNEFYIRDDGPAAATIAPEEYAERLIRFASAIRQADPSAHVLGIGAENFLRHRWSAFDDWNPIVLQRAAHAIDYLAIHNAYYPVLLEDSRPNTRVVYRAMLAAPQLIAAHLDTIHAQIRRHAPQRADHIRIAVTEWGPLFHLDPRSRWIDHVKTLGSALYVASTLKVFIESPHMEIATAFKLNGIDPQAWIGPRHGDILTRAPAEGQFIPKAPYYALQLFSLHFGEILVASTTQSPTYDSEAVGEIAAVSNVPYLDVVSSRSAYGDTLYILAINKDFDRAIDTQIEVRSFRMPPEAITWTLAGTGIDAHTGTQLPEGIPWGRQIGDPIHNRITSGSKDEVGIRGGSFRPSGPRFQYSFPPRSVTVIELRAPATGASEETER